MFLILSGMISSMEKLNTDKLKHELSWWLPTYHQPILSELFTSCLWSDLNFYYSSQSE